MSTITILSLIRVALGSFAVLGLVGCHQHLVFGEGTDFNLGVTVDGTNSEPLQVNAGLRRFVTSVVPPKQTSSDSNGNAVADDEAVSMLSGFQLKYTPDDTNPLSSASKLIIKSKFASGKAAIKLFGDNEGNIQVRDAQNNALNESATAKNSIKKINKFLMDDK